MPHLVRIALKQALTDDDVRAASFPFFVPAIRTLPTLDVNAGVTLFVGENGSGTSTLLEGIASAAEVTSFGGDQIAFDDTLAPQRLLGAALRLSWSPRSRRGFFLRAEDFFGYLKRQARDDARIARERAESFGVVPEEAPEGSSVHVDERTAATFMGRYDSRSHGESFMDLFTTRVHPRGLYLLDEPEAPLSPVRQIALLALILKATSTGAQFIICTHSPILLACPGARIYSFDRTPIDRVSYDDLEHVSVMREFLSNPAAYLQRFR